MPDLASAEDLSLNSIQYELESTDLVTILERDSAESGGLVLIFFNVLIAFARVGLVWHL